MAELQMDIQRREAIEQTYHNLQERFRGRILYGKRVNVEDPREIAVIAWLWAAAELEADLHTTGTPPAKRESP